MPTPQEGLRPRAVGSAERARGQLWILDDCETDPSLDEAARAAHRRTEIGAVILVPILKTGRLGE